MTACVQDIIDILNTIAPFELAEKWDNSGLQAGDRTWPVKRILLALDVTMEAMTAAQHSKSDMLITHHPLVITPEKTIDFGTMPGAAVELAARGKIAILSAHTNLDKANDGLNDYFAEQVGIKCERPFYLDVGSGDPLTGIGRFGRLIPSMTVDQLARMIKQQLNIPALRVAGSLDLEVDTVALCTGSGGSLTGHFLNSSAQVYITGDLKYHEARDIEAKGKAAIDVGHFASEHIVIGLLKQRLSKALSSLGCEVEIIEFKEEKDPFIII
jgi:dinuclear metal center YbgI/SA1388 family protein